MTIEDMKQGISKIRNSVIARVFRELNLIEQWGSGVRRIFKEAEELGLPELQIMEIGMRIRFIVPLIEPLILTSTTKPKHKLEAQQDEQESQVTPQVTPPVTPQVKRLLGIMKGEMSREDLQRNLGLRDRKSFRESYLTPALHGEYIDDHPRQTQQPSTEISFGSKGQSCH
jgi:predicted HTH transcriptional regulator